MLLGNVNAISGVKQVITNLRMRKAKLALGCERGVKKAALYLIRESVKLVPVDTGDLKDSWFTRSSGKGFAIQATVGYTASYALYVHEAVGMVLKGQLRGPAKGSVGYRGRYWDPQGRAQAKFLEEPARRLAPRLRQIIRENARIRR